MIPYGRQDISEEDISAVVDVLRSDFLTQGAVVPAFEEAITQFTNSQYGVAVNSATSALHLACLALGVSKGDRVWTTPITFVASANCALYCGAQVDFVDIDPASCNISVTALEEKLIAAELQGRLPKVIIPVHLAGMPCDMQAIYQLSLRYGFNVIEDASHAIGAEYQGAPVGNCQYSDITVFSFHPVKLMTTGEGGMAVTNQKSLYQRMQLLRSHGVTRNPEEMTKEPDGEWYYQQIELGFNYRITEIQAALGVSQLARLPSFIQRRRQLAKQYDELLSDLPLQLPLRNEDSQSAWHLYIIRLAIPELHARHKEIFSKLREANIGVNLHYIPVHTQPYYQNMGFKEGDFPQAENYYASAISIPLFYRMTDQEQLQIVEQLRESLV